MLSSSVEPRHISAERGRGLVATRFIPPGCLVCVSPALGFVCSSPDSCSFCLAALQCDDNGAPSSSCCTCDGCGARYCSQSCRSSHSVGFSPEQPLLLRAPHTSAACQALATTGESESGESGATTGPGQSESHQGLSHPSLTSDDSSFGQSELSHLRTSLSRLTSLTSDEELLLEVLSRDQMCSERPQDLASHLNCVAQAARLLHFFSQVSPAPCVDGVPDCCGKLEQPAEGVLVEIGKQLRANREEEEEEEEMVLTFAEGA